MAKDFGRRGLLGLVSSIMAVVLTAGCATTGKVSVKPGYDFRKVQGVAVPRFPDARNLPDSGLIVADMIAQELVESEALGGASREPEGRLVGKNPDEMA